MPAGLKPVTAWALVKQSRQWARRNTPIGIASGKNFSFVLPEHKQHVLHRIDLTGGGILAGGAGSDLQRIKNRVLIESQMEEGISTSRIEGAVTTISDGKELLRTGRRPRSRDEHMVVNGYRTMTLLTEQARQPMSTTLLLEIQRSMTERTLDDDSWAGRFRTETDKMIRVVNEIDGEIAFIPPAAKGLPDRMDRLIEFANKPANAEPFIHPLVRAAILHFWLAYEHPFNDGNGRTARALFY